MVRYGWSILIRASEEDEVIDEYEDWFSSDGNSFQTSKTVDNTDYAFEMNSDCEVHVSGKLYDLMADFESFLEKQDLKKREAEQTDWDERKEDWLRHIDRFHKTVQRFLRKYLDQGKVSIDFSPLTLNEEHIGSYETKKLHLTMGGYEVVFSPLGTRMIGSRGRIDMEGRAGRVKFLLVDKESADMWGYTGGRGSKEKAAEKKAAGLTWKIVTPPPSVSLVDLNMESFFDALMEVTNG